MTAMASFELTYDYPSTSPERLFAALADPKTIERMAPFRTTASTVHPGSGHAHGVGSVRRIRPFFLPAYYEKIVTFEPSRLIEYVFVDGGPIADHLGAYLVEPAGAGSRFTFALRYRMTVPGVSKPFDALLKWANRRGFDRLHAMFEGSQGAPVVRC
jgi:hypothetical protein